MSGHGSDPELLAVDKLLASPMMWSKTEHHLNGRGHFDFESLVQASAKWSHGERLILGLALNLWNGTPGPSIMDLIGTLDEVNWRIAMEAIELRRGTRASVPPATVPSS